MSITSELGDLVAESAENPSTLSGQLSAHGVSRRSFMKYSATLTAMLSLPTALSPKVAAALENVTKPTLVWLNFQDCAGNSEALVRARNPNLGELVLSLLSIEYTEVLMAAAGHQAEEALANAVNRGGHIVVVEGSIPTAENGIYCTVGGKTAIQVLQEATKGAAAVLAIGTCATYGGLPAASPNPTAAVGVSEIIGGVPLINIPGCPANADNITGVVAHYLTFGSLPACDEIGRPLFAYGDRIHDNCPKRGHFDAGQFAETFGDYGHRNGWCLYKLGCKGPSTYSNCPTQQFNEHTNWPIGAGAPCTGCVEPGFWDSMTPIYDRLPDISGFGTSTNADKVGVAAAGVLATALTVHGVAKAVQHSRNAEDHNEEHSE